MLVDAADAKAQLGPIYRSCFKQLWDTIYKDCGSRPRKQIPVILEMARLLYTQRPASISPIISRSTRCS